MYYYLNMEKNIAIKKNKLPKFEIIWEGPKAMCKNMDWFWGFFVCFFLLMQDRKTRITPGPL